MHDFINPTELDVVEHLMPRVRRRRFLKGLPQR
jgi:hypothetical protein